jgi:hypothetical protein
MARTPTYYRSNKGFENSIGHSGGSGPWNASSIKVGHAPNKSGWGSGGAPTGGYGDAGGSPPMGVPKGFPMPRTSKQEAK